MTIGLGLSFRYTPTTDAYLVVPAAMQTIGVVARCISKEKQGLNILAYVQWQIQDFAVAYRKLDFSDSRDPLAIVNAQLREQAEAAIKDKIATMRVEEVLTDKEPIIEELTTRLKVVAEGRTQRDGASDEGLGIKIVTVQLKEAFVSSQRLWQDLQAPFRYEQEQVARISLLEMQDAIRQKELATRQLTETREAESVVALERIKQTTQTEAVSLRLREAGVRAVTEQEHARQQLQLAETTTLAQRESALRLQTQAALAEQATRLEQLRREQALELERQTLAAATATQHKRVAVDQSVQALAEEARLADAQLAADQAAVARTTAARTGQAALDLLLQSQSDELTAQSQARELERARQSRLAEIELEAAAEVAAVAQAEQRLALTRQEQEIRNLVNDRDLLHELVTRLPEIAAQLPKPDTMTVMQLGQDGADPLTRMLASILALAEQLGWRRGG